MLNLRIIEPIDLYSKATVIQVIDDADFLFGDLKWGIDEDARDPIFRVGPE